jgi:hypothetical protein
LFDCDITGWDIFEDWQEVLALVVFRFRKRGLLAGNFLHHDPFDPEFWRPYGSKTMMPPNHSLEPTPVGRSFAVDITSPAWLSFGR